MMEVLQSLHAVLTSNDETVCMYLENIQYMAQNTKSLHKISIKS